MAAFFTGVGVPVPVAAVPLLDRGRVLRPVAAVAAAVCSR